MLEVGAGDGKLAFHLRRKLGEEVEIIASDDMSWRIKSITGAVKVHAMDCSSAVDYFRPQLVLCMWMPSGEDWTPQIRAVESVESYVLVRAFGSV